MFSTFSGNRMKTFVLSSKKKDRKQILIIKGIAGECVH